MPYKFYDVDKEGKWHKHQWNAHEAKVLFWIFAIFGYIIPIIIAICSI